MTGGKPFCIYFFLDNISRIILHSSFSLSRSELCISHLSQPEMDLISVVDKRQKTRGLLNSKVCVGGGALPVVGVTMAEVSPLIAGVGVGRAPVWRPPMGEM